MKPELRKIKGEVNMEKIKCIKCDGNGYTAEHDSDILSHDGNGNCLGYCPVAVPCGHCRGTGIIDCKKSEVKGEE